MMRAVASMLCACLAIGGCTSAGPVETPSMGPTQIAAPPASDQGPGSSPAQTIAAPDLSARPLVWFTPHPETRLPDFMKGSADYFDLFAPGAPWATAAARTQVFKVYDNLGVAREPTDDEIRTVLAGIRDRNQAFAMELGPLPNPLADGSNTECGEGVEGFAGEFTIQTVERITNLGGRVDFVAMDEPFAHGSLFEGPTACQWSAERVATEIATYVDSLRGIQPDVIVGDIEPAWNGPLVGAAEVGSWLDAYAAAVGEPLGFFHLDVDWTRDGWQTVAREIEDAVRARDVPFGIIYNGGEGAASDSEWLQLSAERAYEFEERFGGDPDHVVFQSWHFYPTRVLPDTDTAAFTGLINRYFGERTEISSLNDDAVLLQTTAGSPVAGASVDVTATPVDGAPQDLNVSGTVPDTAQTGVVVLRVNSEEAGPGPADINIYEVGYHEEGGANTLVNPRFRQGQEGWFTAGEGSAAVTAADRGNGRMLRIRADPTESLHVDSLPFSVDPGAAFELRVTTAVTAESVGSAYLAVVFLSDTELERHIVTLAPSPLDLGGVITDGAGVAGLDLGRLGDGQFEIRVEFPGDMEFWPAWLDFNVGG